MKFNSIANTLAAVRCLNSGQSFEEIADSAKVTPKTVRRWVSKAGFKKKPDGKYATL